MHVKLFWSVLIILPLLLWFVDHKENLKLLGCRDLGLLHEPRWGSCLLNHVSDGAEEARSGGLWGLRFSLGSRGSGRRHGPSCRGLGRGGGSRGWRSLSLSRSIGPLKVCHVAIGQVGDEGAVRETPTQIIHGCRKDPWSSGCAGVGKTNKWFCGGTSGSECGAGEGRGGGRGSPCKLLPYVFPPSFTEHPQSAPSLSDAQPIKCSTWCSASPLHPPLLPLLVACLTSLPSPIFCCLWGIIPFF